MSHDPETTPLVGQARLRAALLVVGFTSSALASAVVAVDRSGPLAVASWLLALAALLAACLPDVRPRSLLPKSPLRALLLLALFLVGPAVRWLLTDERRIHGDELITGYFSVTENLSPARFFAEVPQERFQWVCQFPPLFFELQRATLKLVGSDVRGLRLSVHPYIFLTGVFLFLATRRLLGERTAVIAVLFSAFLAMSLYLETLALLFVSSTAALIGFFLFALRATAPGGTTADALGLGAVTALCYLLYSSSYVALGLLAVFLVAHALRAPRRAVRCTLLAGLGFVIVIAPYAAYALRFHNYFPGRIQQVSLLHGHWSSAPQQMREGKSAARIVSENLALSVKALFKDGIGGQGGYFFERHAFFEPFTLGLFVLGLVAGLVVMRRSPRVAFVYVTIALSFAAGVVLTIPPPAFHRLSGIFPFLAIVLALPFHLLFSLPRPGATLKTAIAAGAVLLFAARNVTAFFAGTESELRPPEMLLATYVNSRYPNRKLYVAASPDHAFEKIAYFSEPRRRARAVTGYHRDLIERFRADEPYLYVVTFPRNFEKTFHALDPTARWREFLPGWGVFVNDKTPEPTTPIDGDTVVLHACACPASLAPGLALSTYGNNTFEGKPSTDLVSTIGFPCARNAYAGRAVSLVYEGWLSIERSGTYAVRLRSDDASLLQLVSIRIAEINEPDSTRTATIRAEAGCVPIRVRYQNDRRAACLELGWSVDAGRTFREIPASQLFHESLRRTW